MKLIKKVLNKVSEYKDSRVSTLQKQICIIMATLIVVAGTSATFASQFTGFNALALEADEESSEQATTITTTVANDVDASEEATIATTTATPKYDIVVKKYGKARNYVVRPSTVKQVLSSRKITVAKKDKLNCKLSDKVKDGMKIVINKVTYKSKTSKSTVSYSKFLSKYKKASKKGLTKNADVIVTKKYSVKYINGKKSKTTLKSTTFKSAKTISYSSLSPISTLKPSTNFKLSKNGVPLNYSRKIVGNASAYSCGTHTSTGKRVQPGYIAVDPRIIPYGSKLYIRSTDGSYIYGYASAEDTGGFIYWNNAPIADLFMYSESACNSFGRRNIEIYVLK